MLNGSEIGGGSIRIHDQALQRLIFKLLGMSDEEAKLRFGFFVDALEYGTPPHGGIALGLDRIVAILCGRAVDSRRHRVSEDGAGRRPDGRRAVDGQRQAAQGVEAEVDCRTLRLHAERITDGGLAIAGRERRLARAGRPSCYNRNQVLRILKEFPHPSCHRDAQDSGPDEGVESLFGTYDENLKHLEAQFGVRIRTTGHELIVEGEAARRRPRREGARPAGGADPRRLRLAKGDVKTAAQLVAQDENVELSDYFLRGAARPSGKRQVMPKSVNQRRYLDAIEQHDIVFGIGPAGTGKTYLAMAQAVSFLLAKRVSRIILARPAVEAGEKLGFLPGDLQEKVNPYLRPLYDALYDMMEIERADRLLERGTIEVAPIAFMRGRTLNDAFVILDEAQNTTSEQMKMFLTRLGFGSKAVITGDVTQIDLPTARASGLVEAMKVVGNVEGISFVHFDDKDVVRHPLVQQIVKAYEAYGGSRQ